MSIFVFRNEVSDGARELAMALGGRKVRFSERHGGLYFKRQNGERVRVRPAAADVLVCWGEAAPRAAGARILNGSAIRNKFTDAQTLRAAGVPTVEVSQTLPRVAPAPPPIDPAIAAFNEVRELIGDFPGDFARNRVVQDGVTQLLQRAEVLNQALRLPAPAARPEAQAVWLGRMNNHVGGTDLLNPPARPDFYVKKLDLVREFRIHSFCGRSIRAGVKGGREGFVGQRNPWIRSYDAGWSIHYDGVAATQPMRELAHRAVNALGLNFGAVDIGETQDRQLVVLEVNRAPGLEGGTVTRYSNAILRWANNELD